MNQPLTWVLVALFVGLSIGAGVQTAMSRTSPPHVEDMTAPLYTTPLYDLRQMWINDWGPLCVYTSGAGGVWGVRKVDLGLTADDHCPP